MAISIINDHKFFNNKKNAIILFKNECQNSENKIHQDGDFVLIFSNNKVVGINVINYEKYFNLEYGFHVLNDLAKKFLLNKFNNYLTEKDFDDFFMIGEVVEIEQHPNSDKLKVLQVQFNDQKRQIITNYQDTKKQKYLFAINGATTYQGLVIKNSKVMNVESQGMIMSYKSLGIDQEGIIDCNSSNLEDHYKF